ncbi:MAG: tRNA (N(6)-L-threonylcarbamoyladenosine(37)-C(2))-methylthiotransferase MtaB [Candidatus Falkowbacteria bacterium]
MRNYTYKIYTLGCKVNQYDSGSLSDKLQAAGLKPVESGADLTVVNTCAVTGTAILKNRRMIDKAKKENPGARIALLGCWPKVNKKTADDLKTDYVYGAGQYDGFIKKIKTDFGLQKIDTLCALPVAAKRFCGVTHSTLRDKSRYFIKVQDGCEQFCTYCVIPYARGKLLSRPKEEIVNEIIGATESGYKEVILSGIHLGLYGKDAMSGDNLAKLIKEILRIKKLGRVRLSSIEINEVTDDLIDLFTRPRKEGAPYVCGHLHIPLQSGSDKILALMNRPYNTAYFRDKIRKLRKIMPDIAITADVITGFPGETKEDFRTTYDFIKEMNFSRLHVFPFSAHERAPASRYPGQIGEKVKNERADKLRRLGYKLFREYKNKFAGRELEVVVGNLKNGRRLGKSEYYFDIELDLDKIKGKKIGDLTGKIITVKAA